MQVFLIDYGVGNIGSLQKVLNLLNVETILPKNPNDLDKGEKFILPGVGSFSKCMELHNKTNWDQAIKHQVINLKKPLLGICVGMQLLADYGFENDANVKCLGLGLIPGAVKKLSDIGCKYRVPHVGWNNVFAKKNILFSNIENGSDFYFVHSYTFIPKYKKNVISTTNYHIDFTSSVNYKNIWGTQFHPEKSSKAGLELLKNFIYN